MIFETLRWVMRLVARAHMFLYRRGSTAENAFDRIVILCATRPLSHAHNILFEMTSWLYQRRIDRINRTIVVARARLDRDAG